MSYMRGKHYLWRDERHLHVWVEDGYDGWDEAAWHARPTPSAPSSDAGPRASGVAIPQTVIDEYVLMRFAELARQGEAVSALERAVLDCEGNGGCKALLDLAPQLRRMAPQLKAPMGAA